MITQIKWKYYASIRHYSSQKKTGCRNVFSKLLTSPNLKKATDCVQAEICIPEISDCNVTEFDPFTVLFQRNQILS